MHQSKHPCAQGCRRLTGLAGGGVQDIPRTVGLLVIEGCIVDEEIGILDHPGNSGQVLEGTCVAGVDYLPPGARFTHHIAGENLGLNAITGDVDRLSALELSEERAWRDAQRNRSFAVESTWSLVLLQDVAKTGDPVERGKCADRVSVEGHD